jgi:hypothetical protein
MSDEVFELSNGDADADWIKRVNDARRRDIEATNEALKIHKAEEDEKNASLQNPQSG